MGQAESTTRDVDFTNVPTLGYRVLGVNPDSPASDAGLVSFFDFLVGANGRMLFGGTTDPDDEDGDEEVLGDVDFVGLLQSNVGKPVELLVFNIKCQETRLCYITPSTGWGGEGLLGVTIRVDSYADAEENLLRVLTVEDNSPAQVAGLKPESDYLLGTKASSFSSPDVLYQVLLHNEDTVTEIYVYNTESDVVRFVNIMPTYSWGGRGLLGAEVGSGYLHRIPKVNSNTTGSSLQKDGSINESKGTVIDLSLQNMTLANEEKHIENETSPQKSATANIVNDEIGETKQMVENATTDVTIAMEGRADEPQSSFEPAQVKKATPPNDSHTQNDTEITDGVLVKNEEIPSESPPDNPITVEESEAQAPLQNVASNNPEKPETEEKKQNDQMISNEQNEAPEMQSSPADTAPDATQTRGGIFSTFFPPPPMFSKNNTNS